MNRVCLACGSPIPEGKTQLKMKEDEETIEMICPICYTKGQIIDSERLVNNQRVQQLIQEIEIRRDDEERGVEK